MPNGDAPNATSSHMMKTTKRGRPFLKDTLDLFATLIVSLELTLHKQYFRSFPNSFTTDEAAANLASLKFSQSNRGPDPRDPTRIVTTTTTTTFSMTRDMAKAMAQHFMDARLIENAADRSSNLFKERGIFVLTPKGLHVLERFISKNGMSADHLVRVFATQPICMKLLHLERRASDDDIIITDPVIFALFRRFAGRAPNYMPSQSDTPMDASTEYHERSKGIPLIDVQQRAQQMIGKGSIQTVKYCFPSVGALEWLCDFTSIVGRDEAAEMAGHFVRHNLIAVVSDKRKGNDQAIIFTVRGSTENGAAPTAEFRCTAKAIYRITDEGRRVAKWQILPHGNGSPSVSSSNLPASASRPSRDSSEAHEIAYGVGAAPPNASTISSGESSGVNGSASKSSNTDRLRHILEEPALRSLFREFLRGNFCEENLSFWLDVQDFKRRFHTTSSAGAAGPMRPQTANGKNNTPGQLAMEKHHEALIGMTFVIYNTYLAPSSPCELNIDHGLRNELVAYLNEVLTASTGKAVQGRVEPDQANAFNATQLQTMIRLYERIQIHVFRLMATDSVPKFIKTTRFMALRNWVEEYDALENDVGSQSSLSSVPSMPPGLSGGQASENGAEVGRTYLTVSQTANEKAQAKLNNAQVAANMSDSSLSLSHP